MLVEQLHQLGEIGEGTGQPVDLVDDDVDLAPAEIVQQPLPLRANGSIRLSNHRNINRSAPR
jgi:hypothetical protein